MQKQWLSNKDYDFIYAKVPRFCVDLVIKSKKGIVLSLRDIEPGKNTWHLPGGRVRFKETIFHAAARIAKTELAIKIKLVELLGFMEFPGEIQGGKPRHSISAAFLAEITSGKVRGSLQASKVDFFKKLPKPAYPVQAKFLKEKKIFGR